MTTEKRFQVFVSSTYEDLIVERTKVVDGLLKVNGIPCGMEMFPARSASQWEVIKQVIDACDYYVVIVAGRYGSVSEDTGLSYTEMEFDYALEKDIPVLAFLHKTPGEIAGKFSEQANRDKLDAFRRKCSSGRVVEFYTSPGDLAGRVVISFLAETKANPQVGWVRADRVPDESSLETITRLRQKIEDLEAQVDAAPPLNLDQATLARGSEIHLFPARAKKIGYGAGREYIKRSWDYLYALLAPLVLGGATTAQLLAALNQDVMGGLANDYVSVSVDLKSFHQILNHFRALGLLKVDPSSGRWSLTPQGDRHMVQTAAVSKPKARSRS